ncbi:class I SAM-dependent methyltransferase [bacterium]|nr:class I SAM-dependent methyltransferase [bacterium]
MTKDFFQQKAGNYEQDEKRVNNVENIANSILKSYTFHKSMQIMDFGSGTGLLLEKIAPFVGKITAVDISDSMNKELEAKRNRLGCRLEILEMDLSKTKLDKKFDGIISSMTMHHVEDIPTMLYNFNEMLNENGILAIADLDEEDGSFHTEDTGVFHFGFDRKKFLTSAKDAGFKNLKITSASVACKPHGKYPIFLLTGIK